MERKTSLNLSHRIAPDIGDSYAFRSTSRLDGHPHSGITLHAYRASDAPETPNGERINDTNCLLHAQAQ